jgi:PPP family 3-phenylpropionic acid transporter
MHPIPYWRLSAVYFFYFVFVGAFSPFFSLYLQALEFSAADIGLLLSLTQFTRVFGPGLWGAVADRMGRRIRAVRTCAAMAVVLSTGLLAGSSFAWMFSVLFLFSLATSGAMPIIEASTLSRLGGASEQYGAIRMWGSVGFVLAVFGIGYALDMVAVTWLPALVIASLLLFALSAWWIPEPPVHESPDASAARIGDVLRRPEVMALFAACFFMALAHGALYTFYSLFLVENGYSKTMVGLLWSVGVVAEILIFLSLRLLMARFTLRAILLASFACATVRFATIGWGVGSIVLLLAAQLLHGATFGAYHAVAVAATHRLFPGRLHTRGQAIYTAVSFGAGGTLGGIASGLAWETFGATWTFAASSLVAALGLVCVCRAFPRSASADAAGLR